MEKLKDNQRISVLFMLYGILFCVCLITANVLETKQISFGPANMTAGLIVFPVSYIINDVVCEVWGYRRTRLLIWLGFAMNFMFVVFGAIADWIPGAPYWHGEEGFHQIFGLAPRIPLALGGVIPWEEMPSLVITQVTLKTVYEIIALPVTIRVVKFTKKHDHEDVFDRDIAYNVFKVKEL